MNNGADAAPALIDEPVFIMTCARSGSTLLRMIIDSHDDMACPSETNIAIICAQLWEIWALLDPECSASTLTDEARLHIRSAVSGIYRGYLQRSGKKRWCDKSLGSPLAAEKLVQIYDKARFICLYRHAMDMINSGLEATPFGLRGYGFEPYSGASSSVAALADYWTNHSGRILEFEEKHPGICFRVHYEQLVLEPEQVARDIFDFIGASPAAGITRDALAWRDEPGPFEFGDHKIRAASRITDASVGRGMRIPAVHIPPERREAMNQVLTRLGYTPVDRAWEISTVPPVLLTAKPSRPAEAEPPGHSAAEDAQSWDQDTEKAEQRTRMLSFHDVDEEFTRRIGQNIKTLPNALARWETLAIVAYSLKRPRIGAAWRIDRQSGELNSDIEEIDFQSLATEWVFTGDIETWQAVLGGTENLASAVRQGFIRHLSDSPVADGHDPAGMAGQPNVVASAVLAHILGLAASAD